jgi:hypothetical protein
MNATLTPIEIDLILADFACAPSERHCALPQLPAGEYDALLEERVMYTSYSTYTEQRIVVTYDRLRVGTEILALPAPQTAILPSGQGQRLGHLKAEACKLQRPHGPHFNGTCPAGPIACRGGDDGWRLVGPARVVVDD